jgi:hypothetical protein
VHARLSHLQSRHPRQSRLITLGRSHEGRPVLGLIIGQGVGPAADGTARALRRPAVLLTGGIHGAEHLSVAVVLDAAEALLDGAGPAGALDELLVLCVPLVNPDGAAASLAGATRTGRKNGRDNNGDGRVDAGDGVDLNRNFPFRWGALGERGSKGAPSAYWYRGPAPASEPETRALLRLAESERPVASLSYHSGTVAILSPYTTDGVEDPEPNEAQLVAEEIAAGMPQHPEGRPFTVRRQLYPVDGTEQDHYRFAYGTVALLVETGRRWPRPVSDEAALRRVLQAVRPSWQRLLSRYLNGPAVHGEVRDAAGRPVVAEVSLREVAGRQGEVWTSRCRDGGYARFLPGPGAYHLVVRVPGQEPVVRSFTATGRVRIDVTVPTSVSRGASAPPSCPVP